MLILIKTIILDMELDLIEQEFTCYLMVVLVEIFGVDMNSSVHIDNKGYDILILGKGLT